MPTSAWQPLPPRRRSAAAGCSPKAATPTHSERDRADRATSPRAHTRPLRGQLSFDPDARELWWHTYPQLTQPADGLPGHLTARAEARTIRLALIYALLDGATQIRAPAPPRRDSRSGTTPRAPPPGRSVTSPATRSPNRSAPLYPAPPGHLHAAPRSLHRNLPVQRVDQALANLAAAGRAAHQHTLTGGRPAELDRHPRRLTSAPPYPCSWRSGVPARGCRPAAMDGRRNEHGRNALPHPAGPTSTTFSRSVVRHPTSSKPLTRT